MGSYRHLCALLCMAIATYTLQGQTAPGIYKVSFTNKGNTPFSFSQPLEYLSQRALDRRAKQNIALDSLDLPVDPAYVQALANAVDMELIHTSRWFNAATFRSVDTLGLDTLENLPFVAKLKSTRAKANTSAPSKFVAQRQSEIGSYYSGYYGGAERQVTMLNAHLLHDQGAQGQGMLIGVLDSGFEQVDSIDYFQDLVADGRIVFTRDVADAESDVFNEHWHGMSVLSCMAAHSPGDLVGTAPQAQYALFRTEYVDSENVWEEDNWTVAAEICDSLGCDILNTSLGYTTFDDSTQNHSYADLDGNTTVISIAAGIASSKGMIPVTSAGNSGSSAWYHIGAPADAKGTLAVGAVGADRLAADFSSHGYSADGRVKPDVAARGHQTHGVVPWGYVTGGINGTSFSSPVCAGAVACLWQLHPNSSNSEIMDAVRQSGHLFRNPNEDLGYGIPDMLIADMILRGQEPERDQDRLLRVYPSSFQDYFVVELFSENDAELVLELFDMSGKLVIGQAARTDAGQVTRLRVDAREIREAGAYVLRARLGEVQLHQLLIRE